ncbi:azurin [Luteimonas yindakuii]|uniref:Azurin n=1 Tax=Luteimonas yindakuii TaxID=2565782 RepID=A0A4Z1R4G7_9GAMM|nr:azurin [Luteimonas yindakuii]TKS53816.1 azurin [Luteimonas yindakuii]
MDLKLTTLSLTCALALAACGDNTSQQTSDTSAPATPPAAAEPATPAAGGDIGTQDATAPTATPAATDTAAPASGKPEAVVSNCATTIRGDDAMQFSVGSITVPSSCSEFTITLEHVGKMPVAAMGHNVVVSQASDRTGIATDGVAAGVDGGYVKNGDDRVIAASDLIGGGQTTSVTFPVSALQGSGPYEFFCSFPGHWAVMRGSIQVG